MQAADLWDLDHLAKPGGLDRSADRRILFAVEEARGTKDFDFLLNAVALRKEPRQLAQMLERLGYLPVPESRNFQFDEKDSYQIAMKN